MTFSVRRIAGVLLCSALAAGCSSNTSTSPIPQAAVPAAIAPVPTVAFAPDAGAATTLFAGNLCLASHIMAFPISAYGNVAPAWTITSSGLNGTTGLAVGTRLWAAEFEAGKLFGYPPGASGSGAPPVSIFGSHLGSSWNPTDVVQEPGSNDLFVTDHANRVVVLAGNANGNATPLRVIAGAKTKLSNPQGIALAPMGRIAVASLHNNSVAFFKRTANGNVAPVARLAGSATQLAYPTGVGYANGYLYVSNAASNAITMYDAGAKGNAAPLHTISGVYTGLQQPAMLAFDGAGNLYVANSVVNGSVLVFPPGSYGNVTPARAIQGNQTGFDCPNGLAIGHVPQLFVPGAYFESSSPVTGVGAFALTAANYDGYVSLLVPSAVSGSPGAVAFDSAGDEYVAMPASNAILAYAPGSTGAYAPLATISGSATKLNAPTSIGIDAAGEVFASNADGSIAIFASGAAGNVAPLRRIAGAKTDIGSAVAQIAVGKSGDVWAAVPGGPDLVHFAAGANGNTAPDKEIDGGATGLVQPTGIAVNATGVYALDATAKLISLFAPGASGNVAPVKTIGGSSTGFSSPVGLALDASGNVYASDCGANAVFVYGKAASGDVPPARTLGGPDHRFTCPQYPAVY